MTGDLDAVLRERLGRMAAGHEPVDVDAAADAVGQRVRRHRRRRVAGRVGALALVVLVGGAVVQGVVVDRGDERVEVAAGTVRDLFGRSFASVAATDGGEPYPLAPGTRLTLRFTRERYFTADAGCNQFGGQVAAESERTLVVERDEISSTMMACPDRRRQESWFWRLLVDEPEVEYGGGRLVLAAGGRRVELVEPDVDAARHLVGRDWRVDAVLVGGQAQPVSRDRGAQVAFSDTGYHARSACEEGIGTVEWEGGSFRVTGWRREGHPCDGVSRPPDLVALFETGWFAVEAQGDTVVVRNAAGSGAVLRHL